jgi:hypothetical protein
MSKRKEYSSIMQNELPFLSTSAVAPVPVASLSSPSSSDSIDFSGRLRRDSGLFPDLAEQGIVTFAGVQAVCSPEIHIERKKRNGRIIEIKEWTCRAYIAESNTYNLLVLHATTSYEIAAKLRVAEGDLLRVSGRLSANPTPLHKGTDVAVHHVSVTDIAITKRAPRTRRQQSATPLSLL